MIPVILPDHSLSASSIDAIEERIYDHNSDAVGRRDARGLAFVMRDEAGEMIGVAAGYSWAGTSELRQMWVHQSHRGRGYARTLITAFVDEAARRGVHRIWVASYDFQAPRLYEKLGFVRAAELAHWPEGHTNVILCKMLVP